MGCACSLERPYLLLGTSLGYLQLHNATGPLLHRQRMHSTSCCSIRVRNQGQGVDAEDRAEDVTVCFSNAVVRMNAVDVSFSLSTVISTPCHCSPLSKQWDSVQSLSNYLIAVLLSCWNQGQLLQVLSLAVRASRQTTDGAVTDLAVAHTKWELPRSAGAD